MGTASSRITAQDRAILDMKIQRDKLKQYAARLQIVLDREVQISKDWLAKGDKRRALLALRQRKYQEQLLIKSEQQLDTLEQLTRSVEFSVIQKNVFHGLKLGNDTLKQLNKEVSIEAVGKLMDETSDAVQYQNEVSEMLSTRMTIEEEEDALEELEAMQHEMLPNVPLARLPEQEQFSVADHAVPVDTTPQRNRADLIPAD